MQNKLLLMSALLLLLLPAPALAQSPEEGQSLFQKNCAACHTVGGGTLVGPDLQGVTGLRERDWLLRWIMEPDAMLSEGDPIATELLAEFNDVPMPNVGLSEDETAAIFAYLENPDAAASGGSSAASAPVAAAAKPLPPGNAGRGRALFVGQTSLTNGGPACGSCHSAGNIGVMGGGTLGPDLTRAAMNYGSDGLAATLQSLPFPTMQGVFKEHPLVQQDAADLHAFLVEEDKTAAPQKDNGMFLILGLAGSLVLLVVGQFTWRNRQSSGIRKTLVRQANRKNGSKK